MMERTRLRGWMLMGLAAGLLVTASCVSGGVVNEELPEDDTPTPNNTPVPNNRPTPNNNTPPDCPDNGCTVGRFICSGDSEIHVCRQGSDGCTAFVLNETCPEGRICSEALCVAADSCIDNDGDGHGENCPAGGDCDDTDAARHEGKAEICDTIDNDCDGIEDEDGVCDADCSGQECTPGELTCLDAGRAAECRSDEAGCGFWGDPINCGGGQCVNGVCESPDCVDNDGDRRGENCPAGGDCDDNNPNRYEGNDELCDGIDNDCDGNADEDFPEFGQACTRGEGICENSGTFVCAPGGRALQCDATPGQPQSERCGNNRDDNCNGQVDEGFENVGQSCSRGQGACQRQGQIVCDGNGTTCNATPGQPSEEVCDGEDNDCNGQIDEGNICNACADDGREPDQSSSAGGFLGVGQSLSGTLCGTGRDGADWVQLGNVNAGQTINVSIDLGDSGNTMHMELYNPAFAFVDGTPIQSTDHSLTHTAQTSGNYFLWVFPNTNPEPGNTYTISR